MLAHTTRFRLAMLCLVSLIGCATNANDGICDRARDHVSTCGLSDGAAVFNACSAASDPDKFVELAQMNCEALASATQDLRADGQSFDGAAARPEGRSCIFNFQCDDDLVCVPRSFGLGAGIASRVCAPVRTYAVVHAYEPLSDDGSEVTCTVDFTPIASRYCDSHSDCGAGLWCRGQTFTQNGTCLPGPNDYWNAFFTTRAWTTQEEQTWRQTHPGNDDRAIWNSAACTEYQRDQKQLSTDQPDVATATLDDKQIEYCNWWSGTFPFGDDRAAEVLEPSVTRTRFIVPGCYLRRIARNRPHFVLLSESSRYSADTPNKEDPWCNTYWSTSERSGYYGTENDEDDLHDLPFQGDDQSQ